MPDYCNITTDLQRVFAKIEDYQARERLDNLTVLSGTVYKQNGTGYVSGVFWDGEPLEKASSEPSPLSSLDEGAFWYVEDTDTLYINNGDTVSGHIIEAAEDWDSFKTAQRNKAMQMIDAYLNNLYVTPLIPRTRKLHDSADYEYPIVRATALYTCYLIIARVNKRDPNAIALLKEFYNPDPGPDEQKGIINQLLEGTLVLQDQISVREVGHWNVYPGSSNSVDVTPIFSGMYTGAGYRVWRIQIDTGGAVGTATFKVSYDGGTSWDLTGQSTRDTDNDKQRVSINSGISAYFPDATYTAGDYWDLELFPISDTAGMARIKSITAIR